VIDVQGANVTGVERARPWFVVLGVAFLSLLSVGLAMAFLPLAIATFLAVIGTLIELAGQSFPRTDWAWRRALRRERSRPAGWRICCWIGQA
jgi:hypothetical protein